MRAKSKIRPTDAMAKRNMQIARRNRWTVAGWFPPLFFSGCIAMMIFDHYLEYLDITISQRTTQAIQERAAQEFNVNHDDKRQQQRWMHSEAQWNAKVARVGGPRYLRNLRVGDIVDILEESVGPGQAYHMCRVRDAQGNVSVGWYPIAFLQDVEDAK